MKIGIIGLGSIGKRHVRCLKQLGYTDIIALRSRKGSKKDLVEELNYIKEVFNSKEFFSHDLDGIIISNPTSLHIESMKLALEKDLAIFVEKPISDSLEKVNELKSNDLSKVMVGFCLRYNEIINSVKNYLDLGKIGKIYKANLYCGQFLPLWHSYADYRKEYYAKKDLGGGVIRTLSHEIDLMLYFFGDVKELCASVGKISDLEIDVDDNAYLICRMINNALTAIEIDYLNPNLIRRGSFFGSKGMLEYTFTDLKAHITNFDGTKEVIYNNKNYDLNNMYIDQMKDFINLIENRGNFRCNFEDGIKVMKIIEAAEISSLKKKWQFIGVD